MNETNFHEDITNFGEALRILRNRRKITQDFLATEAGISKKYLRGIEKGRHSVGLETSLMLCEALKINRFELLSLAWEDEFKEFLQILAKEKDKERCSQPLTKCPFFFSTMCLVIN